MCCQGTEEANTWQQKYDQEKKRTVIPLSVQAKNEQKNADVVVILDTYEDLVRQTAKDPSTHISAIQICGDQLKRERFSVAKRLRAGALIASERFCRLQLFELFHLQMNLLTVTFHTILLAVMLQSCMHKTPLE